MQQEKSVQSVERCFALLEQLAQRGSAAVTELAAATGLHKATVHRLLATLQGLGYVRQAGQGGPYTLTLKLLQLSSGSLQCFSLRSRAEPFLKKLAARCGETVHLVAREGDSIVYIDKFEAPNSAVRLSSRVGLSLPLWRTAAGKALLSALPPAEAEAVFNRAKAAAGQNACPLTKAEFLKQLQTVKQCGYALDNEENETGVRCVGVALPPLPGVLAYAVSISAPAYRFTNDLLPERVTQLQNTVAEILKQ